MIDTRAVGQDLQVQVLDAARKGRERVTSTVRTITETAQFVAPQLATLPRPSLTRPTLPTPAQLREKAAKLPTPAQLREKATKLPTPAQLMSGAQDLAGHARAVQRIVIEQVRLVAAPLAQQVTTRLAKAGAQPAAPRTSTHVTGVHVASVASENGAAPTAAPTATATTTTTTKAKRTTTGQPKPKPKATTK